MAIGGVVTVANSTGNLGVVDPAASGTVLTSNGPGVAPSFQVSGAGTGDVTGPSSAVANNVTVFADTTGKLLADGGAPLGSVPIVLGANVVVPANYGWVVPERLEIPSSDQLEISPGARIEVTGGLPQPRFIVAGMDQYAYNNTMANDNEIAMSVGAWDVAMVMACFFFANAANTGDVKIQFVGPANAIMTWYAFGYNETATTATELRQTYTFRLVSNPGGRAFGVLQTSTAAISGVTIYGIYRGGGAAGTLQLQFAQQTTDATNPTIRRQDSFLRYERIR